MLSLMVLTPKTDQKSIEALNILPLTNKIKGDDKRYSCTPTNLPKNPLRLIEIHHKMMVDLCGQISSYKYKCA